MATLHTLAGPGAGKQFPVPEPIALIGRQPDAAIWLESPAVSRQHAELLSAEGSFFVEDLGSSNGTFVNGRRIQKRTQITTADTLQVGPYLFALRDDPTEPPPPPVDERLVIREQVDAQPSNQTLFTQNPALKLQVVLEISQLLARTLELEPLLGKLLDQLLRLFPQADRGMVFLYEGNQLVVRAERSRGKVADSGLPYSRTIVARALDGGVGILSDDVRADGRFSGSATLASLDLRSLMCVPLIGTDGRKLGVIQLDRCRAGVAFSGSDLQLLTAVGLQAAVVLENVALHAERLREERLRQELAMAREIQQGFLPANFAPLGVQPFELYAEVFPAREVSGDFYDFFPLPDGRLAFFFGDVSGKGMPAALFMVAVRTLCRHLANMALGPAETMRRLNQSLAADNPSAMFVTLVHGYYEASTGKTVLTSAGHPRPLLRRTDGHVEVVAVPTGRLLGYEGGKLNLSDAEFSLEPGDTLILYTDGFIEAKAKDGNDIFGLEGIRTALEGERRYLPLPDCAEGVRTALKAFTGKGDQQDDLTLLLLRRLPPSPPEEG